MKHFRFIVNGYGNLFISPVFVVSPGRFKPEQIQTQSTKTDNECHWLIINSCDGVEARNTLTFYLKVRYSAVWTFAFGMSWTKTPVICVQGKCNATAFPWKIFENMFFTFSLHNLFTRQFGRWTNDLDLLKVIGALIDQAKGVTAWECQGFPHTSSIRVVLTYNVNAPLLN